MMSNLTDVKMQAKPYVNLYYTFSDKDKDLLSLDGSAAFTVEKNSILLDDSLNLAGSTIWLKKKMPENFTIKYKAVSLNPQYAGNINMFFSALTSDGKKPYECDFQGIYGNYHKDLCMYILTLTGAFQDGKTRNQGYTRLRKDIGFNLLSENFSFRTLHNTEHTFEITKRHYIISVKIDNKQAHYVIDNDSYNQEGYIGFRTWKTKVRFYDFEVYCGSF